MQTAIVILLLLAGLALALVFAARVVFRRRVDAEARALLARSPIAVTATVGHDELAALPRPVRRWLERSGIVGRDRAETVRLRQRGEMRLAQGKPWLHAEAEQYFSVADPGFVWHVDVRVNRALSFAGCDSYAGGKGHMLIEVASLVPVADARGPQIDQGAMLRYLGEIVWFPSAALRPYIRWEEIDDRRARATMTHGGVTVSAVFAFDDLGRPVSLTARRYRDRGREPASLDTWVIPSTAWKTVRGVEIPVRGTATWKLPEGDLEYYRWEILDVEENVPFLYRDRPAATRRGAAEETRPYSLDLREGGGSTRSPAS